MRYLMVLLILGILTGCATDSSVRVDKEENDKCKADCYSDQEFCKTRLLDNESDDQCDEKAEKCLDYCLIFDININELMR